MKLAIERWVEEHQIPPAASRAVSESTACYKLGAYRAGLLFGYLAWALILRSRLVGATAPAGIVAARWTHLQNQLQDEAEWDATVFQMSQQQNPPVFLVHADLRRQLEYWKDRRNDCAHFKDNEINSAHVEAFYSFFLSNIGRFVPNGSAEALVNRLVTHFDPNLTPPGADVTPIAREVPNAVTPAELPGFFALAEARLAHPLVGLRIQEVATFYSAVLANAPPPVADALVAHLGNGARDDLFRQVLRNRPGAVSMLAADPTLLRRLWRQILFVRGGQDLTVLSALLRFNLIPAAEVPEAIGRAVALANNEIPSMADLPVLEANGYDAEFVNYAFTNGAADRFGWGNPNAELLAWYVASHPITDLIARKLCSIFSATPYPFQAQAALAAMFQANAVKRAELARVALAAAVDVPAAFQ